MTPDCAHGAYGIVVLSILTLNIWHDSGPWPQRLARIHEWIERLDPDLIGFQEVLVGGGRDQLAELVAPFDYHVDYVRAQPFWLDDEVGFGNAVASRWPITARDEQALAHRSDGERRASLAVTIDAPFARILFACTHLHWRFHHGNTREEQVVALSDQVLRLRPRQGFPPIVVGDFNAEPESDEIRYLTGLHTIAGRSVYFNDAWRVAGDGGAGPTWTNRNPYARTALEPDRRIDYIFAGYPLPNGVGMLESCRIVCNDEKDGVWPSDHVGLYAELRTEPVSHPVAST